MHFTEVFIRRPLLAWVLNSLILLFGIVAFSYLDLRPYPDVESAQITISTSYPGAAADVVQGFITGPLQRAILGAEGIDYYESSTADGQSTITIYVASGYDTDQVMTELIGKVASVRGELPDNALEPVVSKLSGATPTVWVRVLDPVMSPEQITEFFNRVMRPELLTVEGAAGLKVIGARPFAMRLWLDPVRMAAVDVTAGDIEAAVRANNFISEAGEVRDTWAVQPVRAQTDISSASAFADIVIRETDNALVRLRDVATVELASEPQRQKGWVNGDPGLLIGVSMTPDSNPLSLSRNVRAATAKLQNKLPDTTSAEVFFDLGQFVASSLRELTRTLFEALAIVAVITLLFFGNLRSILIMLISIPLSLVGTFLIMWMLDYSLNLFTLLALVIAIGLVVDDTIVVVENIHRYIEHGLTPMQAAITGAREVMTPVIAMSLTLVAVFLPVGFMQGLSGALIAEFVFTLAGSVAISGIIALTLSPMLCSRMLDKQHESGLAHWLDERFDSLRGLYARTLRSTLRYRPVWLLVALAVFCSIPALFLLSEQELVPSEDTGYLHMAFSTPRHLNEDYNSQVAQQLEGVMRELPGYQGSLRLEGMLGNGASVAVAEFKPWEQRDVSILDLVPVLQEKVNKLTGMETNVFIIDISPAGHNASLPVQMAIQTTDDYRHLALVTDRFLSEVRDSGKFIFAASDLKYAQPRVQVDIDRDKAGELGVTMAQIATTLSVLLGEGYINRFSYQGESYDVVPQAVPGQRLDRSWLERYYVRAGSGELIPLSALVETRLTSQPASRKQFNGLNAATLSLVMFPGVSMQEAIDFLDETAARTLPPGYSIDYAGKSRAFLQSGNTLLIAFALSLLTIYLFLVAQYESLRDPLVVMVTVPMSLCGALIFLCLDFATLSLFSQVGLITLVGLISKHGILMVDFARRLQEQGVAFEEAIIEAASVRLRPILMTTAAIVMAVVPLLIASGPGAVSRYHIGLVITAGMSIGTLFTLFVLPVVYTLVARRRNPQGMLAAD
ncbi:multidrug efflux protein [Mangrovimicrobium sediminis]|uniref:Multidrug efflux protein n=1 Tax=Mangrovimicrobium sediminis TaxID=2562682 RepID=A0A4Z0M4X1_9GAMM|nr:efflux RND transporter permease subunit [Haliea sp. SAOS-164]TGD74743.1 multidrug efflux protein [Haliea sp. SAOS-164]